MNLSLIFWIIVAGLWLSYMPLGISGLRSFLRFHKQFISKKIIVGDLGDQQLIFQFTVKSIKKDILKKSLAALLDACIKTNITQHARVVVVSDDPKDETNFVPETKVVPR